MLLLIVDDNLDFACSAGDIFEAYGCEVVTAGGGEALEMVRQHRPRLVLLDMIMPGMDGLATLRAIRKIAPDIPVIMITGFADEHLKGEAFKHGILAFLEKPLDFECIRGIIQALPA